MYIGPDTIMPLASAFAAVVGVAVMFWHKTVGLVRGISSFLGRQVGRLTGRH